MTEHPHGPIDSREAQLLNETLNLALVERMCGRASRPARMAA